MPGPPPKPLEQRRREGNPGKRPLPAPIRVAPLESLPEVPPTVPQEGREVWDTVGGSLTNVGMLQRQHLPMLESFATMVALARRDVSHFTGEDPEDSVVETKQGLVENPRLKSLRANIKLALSIGEHLGATPVALARLGIANIQGLSLQQELSKRAGTLKSKEKRGAGAA